MVDYTPILQSIAPDLRATLLELIRAVEQNLRQQLARHEDVIDVRALANGLVEAQQASNERMERVESALVEAQQASNERMERVESALVEAQQASNERMERVESALLLLTEAQKRTEARVEQLTKSQQHTDVLMQQLIEAQQRTERELDRLSAETSALTKSVRIMQPRLAKADGWQLEKRYVQRAPSYFGRWLRQIEVLWPGSLDRKLEQQLDARLNPDERDDVLRLDAILRGRAAQLPSGQDELYVVLEASVTVNVNDVERATERAALLRRLGVRVAAVIAGEMIERDAEEYALANGIAILHDGKRLGWEQALVVA